jgi:hypothetical protein
MSNTVKRGPIAGVTDQNLFCCSNEVNAVMRIGVAEHGFADRALQAAWCGKCTQGHQKDGCIFLATPKEQKKNWAFWINAKSKQYVCVNLLIKPRENVGETQADQPHGQKRQLDS